MSISTPKLLLFLAPKYIRFRIVSQGEYLPDEEPDIQCKYVLDIDSIFATLEGKIRSLFSYFDLVLGVEYCWWSIGPLGMDEFYPLRMVPFRIVSQVEYLADEEPVI